MSHRVSRRVAGKILLTLSAAAATAGAAALQQPAPTRPALGACLADQDPALTADERARVAKAVGSLKGTLAAVRDFRVPPDTNPAFCFTPIRSARK